MRQMEPDDQRVLMDWIKNVLMKTLKQETLVEEVIEVMEKGDDTMEYALERVFRDEWNKGVREGMLEGKREGMLEGKREMAKKLLSAGIDIIVVEKASDLSKEELKELLEE